MITNNGIVTVNAGAWNIRKGPGFKYDILATVENGSNLYVTEHCANGWYGVTLGGIKGYISGKAIK